MNFLKQLTKVASFLSICCFLSAAPFSGQAAVSSVLAWGDNAAGQTNTPPDMTNIVAISAGNLHTIALRSDGKIIGWGDNFYGLTNAPEGVSNVVAIAAGHSFNMALTADGLVAVWGDNTWQQTNVPPDLTNVTAIAAGAAHCLALRSDGSLVAWGRNYERQTEVPIGLKSVMSVCAGAYSSMALLSDGRTVAWGSGTNVVSLATNNLVGIYAGNFIVRLDGSVVDRIGQTVSVSNVLMIANGGYHTLALSRDGVVTGWGANLYGSLDIPANTTNSVGIAAGGFHSVATIGVTSPIIVSPPPSRHVFDGSDTLLNVGAIGRQPLTYQWFKEGELLEGATNSSFLLTNFQAINSGGYFVAVSNIFGSVTSSVAALTLNSSAPVMIRQPQNLAASWGNTVTFGASVIGSSPLSYQWQFNGVDITAQTNSTLTLTNVGINDAGSYAVVITNHQGAAVSSNALLSVAPIVSWGAGLSNANILPNYGQSIVPATATNIVAIAAGGFHTLALKSDRKPIAWGWNGNGQTTIPSTATNIMAIAAGDKHNIALRGNGTIVAWGDNLYGQTTVPTTVTNSIAIASGWFHNLAVTNGGVVAWGAGKTIGAIPHLGQSIVPSGLSNVVGISGGGYHSLALKRDGTVIGWGWNAFGQTNVPVGLSNVTAIAAGGSNSLALKADGTVIGWGNNTFGQTNVPGSLSNVVAITANGNSCMALTSSGMLFAWGDNSNGQTNSPLGATNIVAIASGRFHCAALMNDGSLSFISHPKSVSVTSGSTVQFEALAFGTPPIFYQWQFKGTNLIGATNTLLLLTNVGFSDEGTYSVLASNLNRTATSSNGTLNVFDLAEALASASLSWSTNGSSQWLAQTNITHDGTVAAACGPLVFGQGFSEVYTTVNGPGTLTFWWQGTSPYTTFRFYIDGILQTSLSFGGNWSQRTYHLTTGAHVLRWSAGNTWSGASTGTAYLDEVTFVPDREIRFESPQLSATNGGFVLNLTGLSGHGPVIILASTNLVDWRPVLTNPPHVGTLQLLEWSATNQPIQFYRAQEQ